MTHAPRTARRLVPVLCAALLAGAVLAPAAGASKARVFKMTRADMRISLNVKDGMIVRGHVRALEHCGRGKNGSSGFLHFQLFPREAIPLRANGTFHFGESFDDARGSAEVLLDGDVHHKAITGIFAFKNHEDLSCGTGRAGHRKVSFRAKLTS